MSNGEMTATIAYAARVGFRQRYYANDHARDTVVIEPHTMALRDARGLGTTLEAEGFKLVEHSSAVADFTDRAEVAAVHPAEIVALLREHSGADEVVVTSPGILRFSERSGRAGSLDNSMPARFAHIDTTAQTAAGFAGASAPDGRGFIRHAHYNVWRAFSGAPQDVPLAVCDARSVKPADLLVADAIFDPPGGAPEWSFESWLVAHDPAHRWHWFPDMTRDESLIFKTSDSRFSNPVPHVAFDNPLATPDCAPRASIEMRAVAYWYE
jgi:hypothetical protein